MIEIYTKKLQKFLNENVKLAKPQGSQHLLKYVCIIAINMLTAAVQMGLVQTRNGKTAAWLAQLGECRSAERGVMGSNPGRTNTQGLYIAEEKVLPL